MRIAIFTELYAPSVGGQEVRYTELAGVLVGRGHSVSIYCIGHNKNLSSHEYANGVEIFRNPSVNNYQKPLLKPLKRALIPLTRYAVWAVGILSRESFDLMIFNQWPLLHILFCLIKPRPNSIIDWCEIRNGRFYRLCQKQLPRLASFNMAVDESVCRDIVKASGKPVFCLPSGIYKHRYSCLPLSQRSGILYLGRITEHKNLSLLIEAFEILRDFNFQEDLQIAGQGPGLKKLNMQVNKSRHSDTIKILGFVSDQEKIRLLSAAKILVIPSKREGFPRVVAEAMASGLPVVTTNYSENGTVEVLSLYKCGYISEANSHSLGETIKAALLDWESLSLECLSRSQELDWNTLVDSFEDEFMNPMKGE